MPWRKKRNDWTYLVWGRSISIEKKTKSSRLIDRHQTELLFFSKFHFTLLSKKSLASLIFAAMYGEPPKIEKIISTTIESFELASIWMIENYYSFVRITYSIFIRCWTEGKRNESTDRDEFVFRLPDAKN